MIAHVADGASVLENLSQYAPSGARAQGLGPKGTGRVPGSPGKRHREGREDHGTVNSNSQEDPIT